MIKLHNIVYYKHISYASAIAIINNSNFYSQSIPASDMEIAYAERNLELANYSQFYLCYRRNKTLRLHVERKVAKAYKILNKKRKLLLQGFPLDDILNQEKKDKETRQRRLSKINNFKELFWKMKNEKKKVSRAISNSIYNKLSTFEKDSFKKAVSQ